jgi:hypothetical protein
MYELVYKNKVIGTGISKEVIDLFKKMVTKLPGAYIRYV